MKTLIAFSVLALSSTAALADWEDVFRNPDLSVNYQGHVESVRLPAIDPVSDAFPGNGDLYSGDSVEGGAGSSYGSLTSLERLVRGNPDFES
jgi:hypothetical protein